MTKRYRAGFGIDTVRGRLVALCVSAIFVSYPSLSHSEPADFDGDTIADQDEGSDSLRDIDNDGVPDFRDKDSDGDGILDRIEAGDSDLQTVPVDSDGDGRADAYDVDSDNDGVPDAVEDADGDGQVSAGESDRIDPDSDGDGLLDGAEDLNGNGEVDGGESDPRSTESDGDSVPDAFDACPGLAEDFDGLADDDGCPESDADRDNIPDTIELGHPCLDPRSADSDGDGLDDGKEDLNGDGIIGGDESDPCREDSDGDGVSDRADECPLLAEDLDGILDRDGCPEAGERDAGVGDGAPDPKDSDGDGLPDSLEERGCSDPNQSDSDHDGLDDGEEDRNLNGLVDSGESDPCVSDIEPVGGGGCGVGNRPLGDHSGQAGGAALLFLGIALWSVFRYSSGSTRIRRF